MIFRLLFLLTFNFKISVFFRPYAFWPTFIIMFLEGNIQFLTYLFVSEVQGLFSFNFSQKINLTLVVIVFFLIFIFFSGAFFIFKDHYRALTKYLIDNVQIDVRGLAYFTAFKSYKNFCLGFLHGLFDSNYQFKIGVILCI